MFIKTIIFFFLCSLNMPLLASWGNEEQDIFHLYKKLNSYRNSSVKKELPNIPEKLSSFLMFPKLLSTVSQYVQGNIFKENNISIPAASYLPKQNNPNPVLEKLESNNNAYKKTIRILCIDGGGIRGIIPAKILSDMEKISRQNFEGDMRIAEYFDIIAGTSTGGIIALGLNVPDKNNNYRPKYKAEELFELYKEKGSEIFSNHNFLSEMKRYTHSKHSEEGLKRNLQDYFGRTKLGKSVSKVFITAYHAMRDEPIIFKSYDDEHKDLAMKYVARATSAAPTYFDGAEINDSQGLKHYYLDGGVFANNPTFEALIEARNLELKKLEESEETQFPVHRYSIISLGTGQSPSSNYWNEIKKGGKVKWASYIPLIMMNSADKLVENHIKFFIKELEAKGIECEYLRIQPDLSLEHMAMDNPDSNNIEKLIAEATKIRSKHDKYLREFISNYHKESENKEKFYRLNDSNEKENHCQYKLGKLKQKQGKIEEAKDWYLKAAEGNHKKAQYKLGQLYEKDNQEEFKKESIKWYLEAAKQKHMEACYKYARLLDKAYSEEKKKYYSEAIKLGHIKSFYKLGSIFDEEKNEKEAEKNVRKAADGKYEKAQYKMGLLMEHKQNFKESIKWYFKAAERGNELAKDKLKKLEELEKKSISNLNNYFNKGLEYYSKNDFKEAAVWWNKAAEQGQATAQYNLGVMYVKGQGVPQDYKEAFNWYLKAANQGNAQAQFNLGVMCRSGRGVPQGYKQGYKETFNWYLKSAEQGNAQAQFNLGVMYSNGYYVKKNEETANQWYTKAANQGYKKAKKALSGQDYVFEK